MSPIDSMRAPGLLSGLTGLSAPGASAKPAAGSSFADLMKGALDQASRAQNDASALQQRFQLEDPSVSLEDTMISMQKASISFQAVMQARNKMVSAYTEIMNMNV